RYLPKGYSKGLPKLNSGPLAGFPRVYDIAIEIISHSDGHIDIYSLSNFIVAYQKVNHLTIGELWAVPIMIRLALLENLSRMAARIAVDRMDTELAHQWAMKILETVDKNPKNLVLIIADLARSNQPMGSAFVAEFSRKLKWKGAELTLPLSWVEQNLSSNGRSISAMVLEENQKQAADQVSVSNSINSLRYQSKMDWREFVEAMSVVEQTLRKDLNGVYPKMDFHTRDKYRHRVEKIAKASPLSENQVAQIAIDLAHEHFEKDKSDQRKSHVGYYLCGRGLKLTERKAGLRLSYVRSIKEMLTNVAGSLYITVALFLTLIVGSFLIIEALSQTIPIAWSIVIGIFSLIAASHLALSLSNWWVTLWIKPIPLPKLDFSSGIPNQFRSMVVVPTLIANTNQIEKLIEDLEVRFLANPDPNLLFALLTDFKDASSEVMPLDDELVAFIKTRIEELNNRYAKEHNPVFLLFHRPRRWNEVNKVWMGYERKRGKLSELNQLLRGKSRDRFSLVIGDERIYSTVKYVITLDTDTQLPRDAGWKLVGLMAHPLNHPLYNAKKRRVVEGYGIIQPRIAISLHGATRSGYTRLHENDSGIDPYTRVTSDVYQDVLGEGSFIGKGIYDVDAFETALNNRFPENRILSHDLLEGSYVRCGFASDVQLYEEYPSRYSMDVSRRHRWIRGDWQIANWFLPVVPGPVRKLKKNSISALSRWKIFDNLRRSIIPIALTSLLVSGWTILPSPWFWTIAVTLIVMLPSVITSAWSAMFKPKEVAITQHLNNAIGNTSKSILQALFTLICLPYEAIVSVDAILRTLWRVYISHRKLLEWNPSGFVQKQNENLFSVYRTMWFAPLLSITLLIFLYWQQSISIFIAAPFLLAWILSPAIVNMLSKPVIATRSTLKEDQKEYLRTLSRKTWSFFERFITIEDNWLPPDNFQQYPIPVLAHRTSPTNIGLSLLSNLTARDFGYITTTQLIERTENTFATLEKLERHRGHFFNWYDTQTLQILRPRYISTVDSGNMAGHLLTLRQGLLALTTEKITGISFIQGLKDTLRLALDSIPKEDSHIRPYLQKLYEAEYTDHNSLPKFKDYLTTLLTQYRKSRDNDSFASTNYEKSEWILAFENHAELLKQEIINSAPWLNDTAIPEKFSEWKLLSDIPSLDELSRMDRKMISKLAHYSSLENSIIETNWLIQMEESIREASKRARERIAILQNLAFKCLQFANMEYEFLYDKSQRLLAIGYNVDEHLRDNSFYDLLASEARLSSFVAIAQGKLPQESWFALGRRLTTAGNTPVLLSWSGSMFEYLMPLLVMPTYENTLLDEMCIGTVKKQIEYGEEQSVPWGISESCYNVVDAHLTYQYRAFGIPGLGFKRGLGHDLVIAPYATVMALMVDPLAAYSNLQQMKAKGFEGRYGFYEAVDYTPVRLSRGQHFAVIQTFMAHHQGMSLLSLSYVLHDKPMQKRFESDTQFQTALLLLQEQVPKSTGFYSSSDVENVPRVLPAAEIRIIQTAHTPIPEIQLLSNGRYHVMITNAGGGYSRWRDIAINRWREDSTCDDWGTFCFIRDINKNESWSTTHQPTLREATRYETIFSQDRAEFRRRDDEIESYSTIIVSPEDDVEVRRLHLTNYSKTTRNLEITSYGEIVLASPAADDSHPAFSNLFVQTEILAHQHAIVCTRRPRSKDERPPWMFHLMKVDSANKTEVAYETDRNKFIGRGNTIHDPQVIFENESLTGSEGSVLDPIVSIQYKIKLEPGESVTIDMVSGISETREGNQSLIDKYQDRHLRDRAFELSLTHSLVSLRQLGATESDVQLFGKLASSILYHNPAFRASSNILSKNQRGQSALWSYSISGDLPIVLVHVSDSNNITLVKQLVKAQAYWQSKGLAADLVILNEDPSGYRQVLQEQIQNLIASTGVNTSDKQGRIVVRQADQVPAEDLILLQTVARVIISDAKGTLVDQVNKGTIEKSITPKLIPSKPLAANIQKAVAQRELQFYNGLGGFSTDGKEYIIATKKNKRTPLPWSNVIANPNFGTIVTESGSSYTWFKNAHEFRLTPWKNDPVSDACGEAFYIRDEETGHYWSPMALPSTGQSPYVTRHGFGYSIFEHTEDGIRTDLCMYTDIVAPLKFIVITVRNQSDRPRKLSATGYAEWILGSIASKSVLHVVTELDPTCGALIAKNVFNPEFQNCVAFFDVDDPNFFYSSDRAEFIGRNGTLQYPEAMSNATLSNKTGAGMDACAAIQIPFELENGQERKIIFKIGAGKNIHEAIDVVKRFQGSQAATKALENVNEFWQKT
ncbi:MAG TPA: glucoamylase family protein, partial [Chryseolinea sp.]|nr:glucoamylase family protein [Chryseolinea sp.]